MADDDDEDGGGEGGGTKELGSVIEEAKTGRAKCRGCRQAIAKGELRFGDETVNAFSDSGETTFQWYHLACGAKKKPDKVKKAMAAFSGTIPDKAEIEKLLKTTTAKATEFPFAERAPTGRSKCITCEEMIEKGAYRVAIEREIDAGGFMRKGAGYMHPECAQEFAAEEGFAAKVEENSKGLKKDELAEVLELLGSEAE
jgi:hypothetical protein